MQPTTLKAARRRLGGAIGLFFASTTTAGSTATDSLTLGDLADADAETSKFANCYAMPTSTASGNAGASRRVRKDGFTAATGVLRMVAAYQGVTSGGTEVEIYSPLPPTDADGRFGLRTLINRALSECWDIDRINITPSTGNPSTFSLSAVADWIRTDENVVDVWWRRSGSTIDALVPEWTIEPDLDASQLRIRGLNLSTGDTLKIECYRPLDRWIEVNSTWGESTVGLVNDSDRCLLSEQGVEAVGRAHALAQLANSGDYEGRRVDLADARAARADANAWKHANLPRKFGRPVHWNKSKTQGPLWPPEGSLG